MKLKLDFLLLLVLGLAVLNVAASAQSPEQTGNYANPRVAYLVDSPGQGSAMLRPVDWDGRHRCDGDHDRDDRHCYWQDRDGDRYRQQYYSRGNGYYGNAYSQNGWYDQHGNWHVSANGWYDRKGKWHSDKHRGDRDDR
jgi:hypothetical protein